MKTSIANSIDLAHAAYDLDRSESQWREGLAKALARCVRACSGTVSWRYSIHDGTPRADDIAARGNPQISAFIAHIHTRSCAPTIAASLYRGAPMMGTLGATLAEYSPEKALRVSRAAAATGVGGLLWLLVSSTRGEGIAIAVATATGLTSSDSATKGWRQVLPLLSDALRLRRQLETARVDTSEPGNEPQSVRDALRASVREASAARDSPARSDPDAALALWEGVMAGRYSQVDRFETEGRRHIVVDRGCEQHLDPRRLTKRQEEVLRLAAQGYSNHSISSSLGLAPSTVSTHLLQAMHRLGFRRRAELPRYLEVSPAVMDRLTLPSGLETITIGNSEVHAADALTRAERAVAELAARGLNDREIAHARGVSNRTTANQLARVFKKLGVRSRTALSRALVHDAGVTPTS